MVKRFPAPGQRRPTGAAAPLALDLCGGNTYCVTMRNITVSVDDETYKRARLKAAERDTSVSALVRDFLNSLADDESEFERLERLEQEVRKRIRGISTDDLLPRDELYGRAKT